MQVKPAMIGIPLGILIFGATVAPLLYAHTEVARSKELQQQAWSQLHAGMTLAEAQAIVERSAWRRFTCTYEGWRREVYLLGSHNPRMAAMLILEYRAEDDTATLISIGAFEMYMLNPVTVGCDREDLS